MMTAIATKSYSISSISTNDVKSQKSLFVELRSKILLNLKNGLYFDETSLEEILPMVFELRMDAINQIQNESIDKKYNESYNSITEELEELLEDDKLESLAENLLYSLHISNKILSKERFNKNEKFKIKRAINDKLTLSDYIETLSVIPIDSSEFISLMANSLLIEYVMLSTLIIKEENLVLEKEFITSLSFFVKEATQEYVKLASKYNLLPCLKSNDEELDFDQEQMDLAEIGLIEFNNVF